MIVADALKKIMADNNLAQKDIVNELGYSQSQVAMIITKRRLPSDNFIKRVAEKYNLDIAELEKGKIEWKKNKFGNMLFMLRMEKGRLSQVSFAESLKCSRISISHYESGKMIASENFINKLASTYNLDENMIDKLKDARYITF